jgi:spoIIIJ-associated protein
MSLPESLDRPERRYERAEGDLAEAAQEGIRKLLKLGNLDVEADVYQGESGLEIEIRGTDEEAFLEDRGRLLLALQHLLPRVLRGLTGETVPCRVDCDNYQEIRTEQLRVLAQKVAAEVRERGHSRTLEPMSPDERRIVHVTLADDAAVETESQGSGLFKRVMVMPVRQKSRGFDPYN